MPDGTINNKRIVSVDLMRFLAIFLMFADHSFKLFYNFLPTPELGEMYVNMARLVILTTTFSAPLFLFLVGVSAILSFLKKSKGKEEKWLKAKTWRGLFYILISFLLFFYQDGISRIPYTSGILQLIGMSLILVSILLVYIKSNRHTLFFVLMFSVLILDAALKSAGIHVPFLTKINFPILPYTAYVFAGSFVAEKLFNSRNQSGFAKKAGAASLIIVLIILFHSSFNPFIVLSTFTIIEGYIIHSTIMITYYICLMTLILLGLLKLEDRLKQSNIVDQFTMIGKEALNIYILHIILGWGVSKYILNDQGFGFWAPVTAILIFTVLGWLWAKARQKGYFQYMP